ncbi:hypothetical protein COB47_0517 [Caldicellulosiruptor obsidiansis OB47]|uniref:Uncharacterized protein n=1 Tax=Caldicellulosiruptor obsidiansis (strain ATCC BAA-2073 / JCM 16842 / OB47) TaxID=608506 RepID=D9TIK5_CALOO|nr:hypothetical protein [Caldicellulosiruptor obsidiansis]ADL41837.1 hypothetical protein COB47_0517 [Caldicellulosiruptor obsidiansis OB47]
MKKRKLFVLGLLALITIVATIISYNAKSIQQLNNEEEIKRVVKSALNIYSKIVYPSEYTKSPDIKIPSQLIDRKMNEVTQECEKYYSAKSGILANKIKVFQTAVLGDAYSPSDIRTVEWKINNIKFLETRIEGDTATVIADVYCENKMIALIPIDNINENVKPEEMTIEYQKRLYEETQKLPKKLVTYNPKGVMRYYFNLTKENGIWKITSENFNYLPGYEP